MLEEDSQDSTKCFLIACGVGFVVMPSQESDCTICVVELPADSATGSGLQRLNQAKLPSNASHISYSKFYTLGLPESARQRKLRMRRWRCYLEAGQDEGLKRLKNIKWT